MRDSISGKENIPLQVHGQYCILHFQLIPREHFPVLLKVEFVKVEKMLFHEVLIDVIDVQKLQSRAHQISPLLLGPTSLRGNNQQIIIMGVNRPAWPLTIY